MSIYKKLLNSDIASVPFNANKKYSFTSASAAETNIQLISTEYNSASLYTYSGDSQDTLNTIKYHQLDHLFYKNYKTDINNKIGDTHYLEQKRELHKKANIISIPSGLYGLEVKPNSFFFSGSDQKIIDDGKGNLIVSGTNLDNHSIDELERVFSLRNVGGFQNYDLNSHFYREKDNPNDPSQYYNKENEVDSSYYLNDLTYKNISFSEVTPEILGPEMIKVGLNISSSDGSQFTQAEKDELFDGGCHYWGSYRISTTADYLTASFNSNASDQDSLGLVYGDGEWKGEYGDLAYWMKDKNGNRFYSDDGLYKVSLKVQSIEKGNVGYIRSTLGGDYSLIAGRRDAVGSPVEGADPLGVFSRYYHVGHRAYLSGEASATYLEEGFDGTDAMGDGVAPWQSGSLVNENFVYRRQIFYKTYYDHSGSFSDFSQKKVMEVGDTQLPMLDFNDIITNPKELITNYSFYSKAPDGVTIVDSSYDESWHNEAEGWTVSASDATHFVDFNSASMDSSSYPVEEGDVGGYFNRAYATFTAATTALGLTFTPNNVTLIKGKTYKLIVEVFHLIGGGMKIDENGISETFKTYGTHERIITPTANTSLNFKALDDNTEIQIKEISLKEVVDGAHSSIVSPHDSKYNFNPGDDFTISMFINPKKLNGHIISKNTTKTIIPSPLNSRYGVVSLKRSGSSQPKEVLSEPQYPFEIYIDSGSKIIFEKSDGEHTTKIHTHIDVFNKSAAPGPIKDEQLKLSSSFTENGSAWHNPITENSPPSHVVCMCSASEMSIWINGDKMVSGSDLTVKQTQNRANLYIGSKGEQSSFYSGSIGNLVMFNQPKTTEQIRNLYYTLNSYPYVGNIFYSNGLATITNPQYNDIAKPKTHQHTRYYPLDDVHTSSFGNKGSGSFLDLGPYKYSSSGYWNVSAGELPHTSSFIWAPKTVSDATFESVTHNNFTGNMLLFSSSNAQTGSDGTTAYDNNGATGGNPSGYHSKLGGEYVSLGADGDSVKHAGSNNYLTQEFTEDKNPHQPRRGKWSLSFLVKEAAGRHSTASVMFGPDNDHYEEVPFENTNYPMLRKNTNDQLYAYDRSGNSWGMNTSSSAADPTNSGGEEHGYNAGAGNGPFKLQPHYFTTWSESNHIVCSWDGTDETNAQMTWWRNGQWAGEYRRNISKNKFSGSFGFDAIGGSHSNHYYGFSGSIGQVRWFDYNLSKKQVQQLNQDPSGDVSGEVLNKLEFKGSHYIYENEYQCTVESHEYNYTHNITTRKIQTDQHADLANFATGSLWNPYVTTVGLYNEDNELLVVGKLGQPIRMSDETDTTFIIRWDA